VSGQSGYTLVETLAALMLVSVTVAGLSAGVQVLLRQQAIVNAATSQTRAAHQAQSAFDQMLNRYAPYRTQEPEHFSGGDQALRLSCGEASDCTLTLSAAPGAVRLNVSASGGQRGWSLHAQGRTHFRYDGTLDTDETWPPASGRAQALRSVAVVEETPSGPTTLLKAKVWAEEPLMCAFDSVQQDCR
jgi:prepilin-type N-terminal cleavage/methylation domain-containing protein